MDIIPAMALLAKAHTGDDELTGFVVTRSPALLGISPDDYYSAWATVRAHLHPVRGGVLTCPKPAKTMFEVKHDFVESLDAFIEAVVSFRQAVGMSLERGSISGADASIVREKLEKLDATMLSRDDENNGSLQG